MQHLKSADEYLKQASLYQLGFLPTEQQHPWSRGLSEWAKSDLKKATDVFYNIDLHMLHVLQSETRKVREVHRAVNRCWKNGGRVFVGGCGATGRLALEVESLFRKKYPLRINHMQSFMAGGDIALVHSLEGFEDYPEYGARHLRQLGFSENDLFIGVTEGGETPFVIGATLEAAQTSQYPALFLHTNPSGLLKSELPRCQNVFRSPNVMNYEFCVGPMALSGSTRLQSSTLLMAVLGLSVLCESELEIEKNILELLSFHKRNNYDRLQSLIQWESHIYKQKQLVHYLVDPEIAITIFTDTTERSPTFYLKSFEHDFGVATQPSWSFVGVIGCFSKIAAWQMFLGRSPIQLQWSDIDECTSETYLKNFDFSEHSLKKRVAALSSHRVNPVHWKLQGSHLLIQVEHMQWDWLLPQQSNFLQHLVIKMWINCHSTLVMGRLNRYQSNVMTWVKPSNGKLIDRACRYIILLAKEQGENISYQDAVMVLFKVTNESSNKDHAPVLKALEALNLKIEHPIQNVS